MREAVEVMAIAIAVSDGWRAPFNMHDLQFAVYVRRANAALAALDAAGFVVVPKEPTEAMREAAMEVLLFGSNIYARDDDVIVVETATSKAVYRAMLAAAQVEG